MSDLSGERRDRFRNKPALTRCLALSVAVLGSSLAAEGQTVFDQNGFGDNRGTYSALPYEHVDPLSGNLLLVVTDLALPGNAGMGLQVQRVYNSAVYPDYESGSRALEEDSWAGIGWRLHFGRVLHEEATEGGGTQIEMSDGGRHGLFHTTFTPDGWITKDFWVYNKNTHMLKLPNGVVYTFGHAVFLNPDLGVVRYVTEIRDPFNNTLTFSYFAAPGPPDGVAQVRQVLGAGQVREVNFGYDPTLKSLSSMTYDGRTWTFTQQPFGPPGYSALTGVQPPAGKPWGYTYESVPGYVGLTSMLVPGGGVVSYAYADETRYAGTVTKLTRVVRTRSISGHQITPGTWTFSYNAGPNRDQSVVSCPCGTTTYRYLGIGLQQPGGFPAWSTGVIAERTVEDSSGLLEREVLTWQRSEPVSPDPMPGESGLWTDPAVYNALLQTRVVTRGPQSWTTAFEYRSDRFNEFGRAWRITESGELSRTTRRDFTYGFAPYIVDRVAWQEVQVAAEIARSEFTYDLATGFLRETNAGGIRTRLEPTAAGNLDAVLDANNNRTSFLYAWGVVSETRTPLLTSTRTVSPAGLTLSETVGSLTTQYAYDNAFRPTVVRPPGAPATTNEIRYEYDGTHQEWVRVARGAAQTSMQLDGFGRVVSTSNFVNLKTRTTRDACGRAIYASAPYTTGEGNRGVSTQYDALGRVRLVVAADGVSTTRYTYTGIDVTIRDPANRVTVHDNSAFGGPHDARLITITDALNKLTRYTYDVLGNLTRVDGPGTTPARVWTYTASGLPLTSRQPESGLTQYVHDLAGRLTRVTDANNHTTIISYDANNRVIARDAFGTDADVTYTYDALGRPSTVTTAAVATTYGYDAVGRVSQRSDVVNGRTFTSTYGYDANDSLTTVTYPGFPANRRTVTYAYDIENRLTAVRQNGTLFAQNFVYDDSGRLTSYQTGVVTHAMEYDARDRVQRLLAGPAGTPAIDLGYRYDTAGRVDRITDTRPGMTQMFGYDDLDRLTSASGPYPAVSWTYDAAGNRLTQTMGTSVVYNYHPATQRLTNTTGAFQETFTYDNVGQVTTDTGGGAYTYAANGLMRTATNSRATATYTYDGDELRILHDINGRTTYTVRSVGGQVLAEYEDQCGTLVWVRDQIHAGARTLGAVRANLERPTVGFETAASTVGEAAGTVAPRVRLTTPTGAPLTCAVDVPFGTTPSTAADTSDFTRTTGHLTFPAGTPSGALLPLAPAIAVLNDGSYELDEAFMVDLTSFTGATVAAAVHWVTIQDNDPPPTLTINDIQVNESAGTATFDVRVSQPSGFAIQVSYATGDQTARAGRDYTAASSTVTVNPMAQSATVSIPVTNDGSAESPETFAVNLSNAVNATILDGLGVATIQDDEPPRAPIDLTLPGNFFADGTAVSGQDDYIIIGNRHPVPVRARLTFTRPDGSGTMREFVVPARQRLSLRVGDEPGIGGGEVSIAVQSTDRTHPLDAEHSVYGPGFQAGRSTEGVAPADSWYFAEGSVGYFEEWITVYNPTSAPVDLIFAFMGPNGFLQGYGAHIEEGPGRFKVRVRDVLGPGDHATQVRGEAPDGSPVPIVAERTMAWETDRRETHSSPGVPGPQRTLYFAEGDTGFATYLALANPFFSVAQTARIEYLHENGTTYTEHVTVPPLGRATVPVPGWLPLGSFGTRVTTLLSAGGGFVAERMMYGGPNWTLGHVGVGVSTPSTVWLFEEGGTGFFNTFILLANPSAAAAHVGLTFIRTDGGVVTSSITVPAGARRSVSVDAVPGMASTAFRTEVSSDQPIVAERASYWPGGGFSLLALSNETSTPGDASTAVGINPYALGRHLTPPNFYHALTPGEPAGPLERELAAALTLGSIPTKDRAGTESEPATAATTSSGGWYGAHVTGGRRP